MKKEEFNTELKKLEVEYDIQKKELATRCAKENNPYKINDVVTDHMGSILIEKIGTSYGFGTEIPYSTYFGIELKKNGEPTKKGTKRLVYQINIEE